MKKVTIMGSTGSIGTQALDIIRKNGELKVAALGAGKNLELLEKQAREFMPSFVCIESEERAKDLADRLSDTGIKVLSGHSGLLELASSEGDMFLNAIVGMIGIEPTLEAVNEGKKILLANKETLVAGGHLIMPLAKKTGSEIVPLDSEHSAIYQCLSGCKKDDSGRYPIGKIWLTASGGPFRGKSRAELENVTVRDALAHPNWSMGVKVTIDSATLVNKGLEVMEARWLFDTPVDDINVIVQPDSIIHSMVEFRDGSVMAQMALPDMHLPIEYALLEGKREDLGYAHPDFFEIRSICFEKPDTETLKGLSLALYAAKAGGSMPVVFNAANEAAVRLFVGGRIRFLDIYDIIENAMTSHKMIVDPDLECVLSIQAETENSINARYAD